MANNSSGLKIKTIANCKTDCPTGCCNIYGHCPDQLSSDPLERNCVRGEQKVQTNNFYIWYAGVIIGSTVFLLLLIVLSVLICYRKPQNLSINYQMNQNIDTNRAMNKDKYKGTAVRVN